MSAEYAKFPTGVNIIIRRGDKILLGKRKGAYGAGSWCLPGGHLEAWEAMVDAAARELKEETGLTANKFRFANLVNDRKPNNQCFQIGFVAEGVEGEPKILEPDRCEEWRWCDVNDLPNPIFLGHQAQIRAYLTGDLFVDA